MTTLQHFTVGTALPPLPKGPLMSSHIVRWCAAQQNWDKIHYDQAYAVEVAGLPGTIVNGALKQQFLAQCVSRAFGERAWLSQLDCRFTRMDRVGQRLTAAGTVREIRRTGPVLAVHVDLHLFNLDEQCVSTEGGAVVLLSDHATAAPETLPRHDVAPETAPTAASPDDAVPAAIRQCIGTELERRVSCDPVEAGRLRLFAAAVMDLPAHHYDSAAGRDSVYGEVVAPPLFPIHAISPGPHEFALDPDPRALGREGVAEVGRNLAQRFGLPPQGLLNGGTRLRIHALARVGDTVRATCRLAAARHRVGNSGVGMLVLQTENRYETTTGRLLLTEQQTVLQRLSAPP